MARLLLHVEGQTEETFVNEVLRGHLVSRGYSSVGARLMGSGRRRRQRGGVCSWPHALRDICGHLKQDPGCIAGTIVDYYGLPETGEAAWPGRAAASGKQGGVEKKARTMEDALSEAVAAAMGRSFSRHRFVPYVMMHEFEAMLFSDCSRFCGAIGRADLTGRLQAIRDEFDTPEDIDDSRHTAPSRRILGLMPSYEKPLMGNLGVIDIGLDTIRRECPHLRGWLERLEEQGAT